MKRKAYLLSALLFTPSALEAAETIPYGVEFLGGIRSGYHQRGMRLANDLVDLQLQSTLTLEDATSLNVAVWRGAEASSDFSEFGALVGFTKAYDKLALSSELAYYAITSDKVKSSLEASVTADYALSDFISAYCSLSTNSSVKNFYAQVGISTSIEVNDKSYLQMKSEVHMAQDYFGRTGIYDVTSRVDYTYNVNDTFSLTPFLSGSVPLDDKEVFNLSTGLWIEVFF